MLTRVRLNYKQEMVLQLSHKKEMVVPLRKKKETVTHPLRVQLTRGKLMKKYLYEMEADGDERGLEEDSSDDDMTR
jgi:ribosomal protein L22